MVEITKADRNFMGQVLVVCRCASFKALCASVLWCIIALTTTEETADYLLELMNDQNKEVSRTCNRALDIIMVSCCMLLWVGPVWL